MEVDPADLNVQGDTPTRLFQGPYFASGPGNVFRTYDVSADGERFVMIRISDSGSLDEELIAVENWFEELKRLVPIN